MAKQSDDENFLSSNYPVTAAARVALRRLRSVHAHREDAGDATGWAGRARRAHLDMLANMVLFAPLIVITEVAARDNRMTEIGAQMFFWTRLAYATVYIVGVPRLRTAVWSASAVALVLIFLQLL